MAFIKNMAIINALEIIEKHYPIDKLPQKTFYTLQDLLNN